MPYSTLADVKDQLDGGRLIQLTDDEDSGAVNEARVAKAIDDADREIDGYLGARFTVPLLSVSETVRRLSVDIAVYNLYSRREKVPEHRMERYRNAIRFLEQAASGKVSLGAADPDGTPLDPGRPETARENPVRAFTRSMLSGF